MARRQYGTGSVYQRSDGKWVGSIEAGWTTAGTRRRVTVSATTEAEAKKRLRAKQRQIIDEGKSAAFTRNITVKAWAATWLPLLQERVRHGHHTTSKGNVDKWIVPTLGTRKLGQLTPADVRKLHATIRAAGRSESTVKSADSTLRTMLKDARLEGHQVPENVLATKRPRITDSTREAIPVHDVISMLKASDGTDDLARWVLAFHTGMRQAEVLGLTWDCVDLEAGVLTVAWQLREIPTHRVPPGIRHKHLTGSYYLTELKTGAGYRSFRMTPATVKALKLWRSQAPANPWGLVFTTRDWRNGRDGRVILPRRADTDRKAWKRLQDDAGVQRPGGGYWKIHETRHGLATLLAVEGVPPEVAAAILGQASLVRDYLHVKAESAAPAMERIGRILDHEAVGESL